MLMPEIGCESGCFESVCRNAWYSPAMRMRFIQIFTGILLASSGLAADNSPTPDQLRQYLRTSAALSALEVEGTAPFHLKASVKWLAADHRDTSAPVMKAEQATIEVLWKDFEHNRITIFLPTGTLVDNDNGQTHWRTGKWVIDADFGLAEQALLNPFRERQFSTDRVHDGTPQRGQPAMDCIDTAPELPGVSPDATIVPMTYCLAKGNHLLRLIKRPNNWTIAFNDIKNFGDKSLARSIAVASSGVPVAWLQVDKLETAEDFSILNEPMPDGAQVLHFHMSDAPLLTGEIMRGTPIYTPRPSVHSALGHSGMVVLSVHVDTTGAVSSAEVINSPSDFLSAAAISAVKQWRFSLSYQATRVVPIDDVVHYQFP